MDKYYKQLQIDTNTETAFKAFSCSEQFNKWYDCKAQFAFRKSGHFTIATHDGDVYESGEYLEINPNVNLSYSLEHHGFYIGSKVNVNFESCGDASTQITLEHIGLSQQDLQHAAPSWDWALANLKNYLEQGETESFKSWFEKNKINY